MRVTDDKATDDLYQDVIKVTHLVFGDDLGKGGSAQKESNRNSTEY